MSFYKCFDWIKKLRLFVNERNLKIDVVLKASSAVAIRWFSLNEAPLGLYKFISDYLPYFDKINIFFNIIAKKVWINLLRIDRNYLFGSFEITSIRLYTLLRYTVWTTWLRLFLHEPNKNCDQSLNVSYLINVEDIYTIVLCQYGRWHKIVLTLYSQVSY
jgi:hypothetical protein